MGTLACDAGRIVPVEPGDVAQLGRFMTGVIATNVTTEAALQSELNHNVLGNLAFWQANPQQCCHLKVSVDGRLVGVVLVKNFWNLCSLFVAPDAQRQGLGRALVLAAAQDCRNRSEKNALWLNAAPDAVAFYRRLGFVDRPSTRPLPPGFAAMQLPLA